MGTQIIKQPDGRFGLFSTYSDRIYAYDMTEEDMVEVWKKRAASQAEEEMRKWLAEIEADHPHSKPISLDEALKDHQSHPENAAEIWRPEYAEEVEWDKKLQERFPGKIKTYEERQQDEPE